MLKTKDEMRGYIAAFIDGEGHVSFSMTRRGRTTKAIAFTNTDKQLFDRVVLICKELGFPMRTYFRKRQKKNWSDTWVAYFSGGKSTFELFRETIPIQCERKLATLDEMIASYRSKEDMENIYSSRRTSVKCICEVCREPFYAFPSDLERGHGKYCSSKCSAKARSRKIPMKCEQCDNDFLITPSRKDTAKYCSQRCVGLSRSEYLKKQSQKAALARWRR